MLAFAIEKTVNDTSAAHLEQTRAKRAARTMKTYIDIVDTCIECVGNAFARFLKQISAPDDFGIIRPERWQESIETVADGSFYLFVRHDFRLGKFGKFLILDLISTFHSIREVLQLRQNSHEQC